jgi:hypothetical protein
MMSDEQNPYEATNHVRPKKETQYPPLLNGPKNHKKKAVLLTFTTWLRMQLLTVGLFAISIYLLSNEENLALGVSLMFISFFLILRLIIEMGRTIYFGWRMVQKKGIVVETPPWQHTLFTFIPVLGLYWQFRAIADWADKAKSIATECGLELPGYIRSSVFQTILIVGSLFIFLAFLPNDYAALSLVAIIFYLWIFKNMAAVTNRLFFRWKERQDS